jgi:hypothetical protein
LFIVFSILFALTLTSFANALTSSATTANPLPASPALAASIAAFIASIFVLSLILFMNLESSFIELNSFMIVLRI